MVGAADLRLSNFASTEPDACADDFWRKSPCSFSEDRYFLSTPIRPAGCSAHSRYSIDETWRWLIFSESAAAADEVVAGKVADKLG
jgi:hypothetical protein